MSQLLDQPGDTTIRDLDRVLQEYWELLPTMHKYAVNPQGLYGVSAGVLQVGKESLISEAVKLRRAKIADSRAHAVELAFDFWVAKATKKKWERVGEVWIGAELAYALGQYKEDS